MTVRRLIFARSWLWLSFALGAVNAWSAAPAIDASLEPAQITLGESARLTIMASGSGVLTVPLPVVPGLEFRVVGQARQVQITNGFAVSSTSTIIRVTPQEAGVFNIPGVTPKSPSMRLRVLPANGSQSSVAPNVGAPGQGPSLAGGTLPNGFKLTSDGAAFIHLDLPKHELYVGESVPVEIELGMRHGFAAINGLPTLKSQDFTLNNLTNQPEHFEKTIEGKPFTVVRWRSLLSPVKPGMFSLNIEAPFRVRIRTQPPRESILDDLLGDPFMQNLFGASVVKDIVASSPQTQIKVLALPTEGKPADFSGAVGAFKIATDVSTTTTNAGDPVKLRMHVSGAGNFDRVDSRMLNGDGQWKTYLPKSTFKARDAVGFKGEKTFEQPLIASRPGQQRIAPLTFSFFDPATRRYETVRSLPLNVTVAPAAADAAPASASTGPAPTNRATGLRPDHVAEAPAVDSLVPLPLQPRFLSLPSFLALAFAGVWLGRRYRHRRANESGGGVHTSRLLQQTLGTMQSASAAGDAAVFFASARSALQQQLAQDWRMAPQDITLAEIDARLGTDSGGIREVFVLADEANYSGHTLKATDFARWQRLVLSRGGAARAATAEQST